MYKPLSLYIGLRYTRTRRQNHFISFISLIAMGGIALGITALITVLSVMNGFHKELRDQILGLAPHIIVTGPGAQLSDWAHVQSLLATDAPAIHDAEAIVEGQGMISQGGSAQFVMFTGIDPDSFSQTSVLNQHITQGTLTALQPGDYGLVIGERLARQLGVTVGDTVVVIVSEAMLTPAGVVPRTKRFTIVGTFAISRDYDSGLVFMNRRDAQVLWRMGSNVSQVIGQIDDLFASPKITQQLREQLGNRYIVYDWTVRHGQFFAALQLEKTMMFIILSLIVAVAAFNILSTLVMTVTDKQADIAILRTLGASPGMIVRVFMVQGCLIGLVGTILGMIGGIVLSLNVTHLVQWLEYFSGSQLISENIYFLDYLPVDILWTDVARIGLVGFILSLVATLYPAWRAARVQPAEALRYE